MGLLATVDDLKGFLGKDNVDQDGLLSMILEGVSKRMERYMGLTIEEEKYTLEPIESPGYPAIVLDHGPVVRVITVKENSTTLVSSDYRQDGDTMLVRLVGGFSAAWAKGTVFVTYEAGYEDVPADLGWACVMQCAREYKMSTPGGALVGVQRISPTQQAGESTSYEMKPWLPQVEATLKQYRVLI